LNWVIVGLAGLPLVGSLYGAESLYVFWQSKSMAPLTSIALITFSVGIFMNFPGHGLLAAFSDRGLTGRMIRILLPMALLIPIFTEWFQSLGEYAGWYSPQLGHAMMAVTTSGLLVAVIFWNARSLRKLDVERDEALQMVALGERRLQAILDNTPAVIYIKDHKGQYVLFNRKFETIFHRSGDMVGKTAYDLFPSEQAKVLTQDDGAVLEKGEAGEFEETVTHPDGEIHTYFSVKFPLWDPMRNESLLCGISVDITRWK
jgi:PAS domain S-box-containing protein